VENEFMKRGYLLPQGCKDLIDVLNLKLQPKPELPPILQQPKIPATGPFPILPILGELIVPEHMTVRDLAEGLKQKPFKIIADLMELGSFANVNQEISFKLIAKVAQKYGYIAKRPS
jgi:translation initiation factor IF-2